MLDCDSKGTCKKSHLIALYGMSVRKHLEVYFSDKAHAYKAEVLHRVNKDLDTQKTLRFLHAFL